MKKISIYSLLLAMALLSIQACGPSEEERRAAEQARLDSLRQVEQQRIAQQVQAYEDSVARANQQQEMQQENETEFSFAENGNYAVQVGAFRSEEQANSYRNKLRERDYPNVYTVKVGEEETGDIWFRLRVGYFASKEDAEEFGRQLGQELDTGYWVSNVR
ncbi:MAG: SPOR domain-containing protein [Gracilimonas sp.]|uniref:SPOR domain-containing protein n=1 Tax=Gracilimonas sp. TaxID=1974203 RepID=UPI00198C47E1|nr:SPOR domain-containing protein [Gracilimonas sp.]MBD3617508.1 SPOR domain-containing protein [Gracilimonas sp.]